MRKQSSKTVRTLSIRHVIAGRYLSLARNRLRQGRGCGFHGGAAPGTGNVCAGPKIVVFTQAIGAKVKLMYPALNYRLLYGTAVAGGFTRPLAVRRCTNRRSDRSQSARLDVKPAGNQQHAG